MVQKGMRWSKSIRALTRLNWRNGKDTRARHKPGSQARMDWIDSAQPGAHSGQNKRFLTQCAPQAARNRSVHAGLAKQVCVVLRVCLALAQ